MASRLSRQVLSRTTRVSRSLRSNGQRFMSADAAAHHEFKPKSDLPWLIAAAAVTVPTLGYLLKDTFAIKERIAAGHHGHDDAHAHPEDSHEEHPVVIKDDEGQAADVTSSFKAAEAADAPKAAGAATKGSESSSDAAAEPPKDEKQDGDKAEESSKDESK